MSWLQNYLLAGIVEELSHIRKQLNQLDMKLSEALTILASVKPTLEKAKGEIIAKIDALNASDPDISDEGKANIESIAAVANALDAIVPDTVPTPPEA